ncbi:hypothetical protein OHR68_09700 [Spirillospora sp. NBC_00431]
MSPPAHRKDSDRKAVRDAWKKEGADAAKESQRRHDEAKANKEKGGEK